MSSLPETEPLTIGMVGLWPPPFGGVATVCEQLSRALTEMGHTIHFLDVANRSEVRKDGTSILSGYRSVQAGRWRDLLVILAILMGLRGNRRRTLLAKVLTQGLRVSWLRTNPGKMVASMIQIDRMAQWLDKTKVNVVIGHHAGLWSWESLMVAQHYLACPMLVIVYGSEFTMEVNRPLKSVALAVCEGAHHVVFISKYTQLCALEAGVKNPSRSVVGLGCDQDHFKRTDAHLQKAVSRELGLLDNVPLILYVGWLISRKGPQVLMEALRALPSCDWQAVFVGPDGGLFNPLQQSAKEERFQGRIHILSPVTFDQLRTIYDLASIFVFPTVSRDEGFGLVALEAMAHGLPVIGSRTGAIPEIVQEDKTGWLFEPGNANELAERLGEALNNPSLCTSTGAAGREFAMHLAWATTASRINDLVCKMIHSHA